MIEVSTQAVRGAWVEMWQSRPDFVINVRYPDLMAQPEATVRAVEGRPRRDLGATPALVHGEPAPRA